MKTEITPATLAGSFSEEVLRRAALGKEGFRIHLLKVYDSNISFLLQFTFSQSLCISPLLGCEEIRKKRNVGDI